MKQGIKEKDIRDFIKCAEKLDIIIKRIRQYKPEAELYVSEGELYLLSNSSHIGYYAKCNDAAIVKSVQITGIDGGVW